MKRKKKQWWIIRSGKWNVAVMSSNGLVFVPMDISVSPHLFRDLPTAEATAKRCKINCYTQGWIV